MRSVISDAHVAGNDEISCDSVACGRRNSLQEGLFHKIKGNPVGLLFFICNRLPFGTGNAPSAKGGKAP